MEVELGSVLEALALGKSLPAIFWWAVAAKALWVLGLFVVGLAALSLVSEFTTYGRMDNFGECYMVAAYGLGVALLGGIIDSILQSLGHPLQFALKLVAVVLIVGMIVGFVVLTRIATKRYR